MSKELNQAIKITGKMVDQWLPLKIGYDHTPGAVVCIAVGGVPKYTKAFGLADLENETTLKAQSQFRIASMSKMFTAVAVLQLQEQGRLRLDDQVAKYLPWFKGKTKHTDLANVTVRQLLSHNAGLFRDGATRHWVNDVFPKSLKRSIGASSIIFDNATTMKYSNHGYAVLGAVIEKVSGHSYDNYVAKNIITPLGLKNTQPDLGDELPRKLVQGYERWRPGSQQRNIEPHIKTNAYAPATGFLSDAKDIAVFLTSLHPDSKKQILTRESRKLLLQVQTIVNKDTMYGLGVILNDFSGEKVYGHAGGFAGFITNAISHCKDNIQVIVLTNTHSSTALTVSESIMKLIYGLKNSPGIEYVPDDPYTGVYRNRWSDSVIASTGKDLVRFAANTSNPLRTWSKYRKEKQHVFRNTDESGFDAVGETIAFKNITDGKAAVMESDSGDAVMMQ